MTADENPWARPHYTGGGTAMIWYVLYGTFPVEPQISRSKYRTEGLPPGTGIRKLTREQRPVLPFSDGDFGNLLSEKPQLFALVQQAPECLTIQGHIADPATLAYLRDSIGVVTYFVDNGGVAVLEVQQLSFYDGAEWRRCFFERDEPNIYQQVRILYSDEPHGTRWFHTRGMRKFGRPDLSLAHVPPKHHAAAIELCNRFIDLQARGGIVPEGEEIRMNSLPAGLICHHRGSLDDPDFNNVHIEIEFPAQ
jgi:hypothetical protein